MRSSSFGIRALVGLVAMFASVLAFASPASAGLSNKPPTCDFYMANLNPTHEGDDGPNTIVGTNGDDIIFAYGGNDIIRGRGGNDIICGGEGNDRVDGGSGSDTLYGGDDNDRMYGRAGTDFMFGGDGNDYMAGANGGDEMHGQAGNDRMFGQNNNDTLFGSTGDDTLNGGRDFDFVDGGEPAPGDTENNRCKDAETEVNCGEVTGPPVGEPDLTVQVSDIIYTEVVGEAFVEFSVTNNGAGTATNAFGTTTVINTLGADSLGCAEDPSGGLLGCSLGNIAPGATVNATFQVFLQNPTGDVTFFVSHDVMDANPADNTATALLFADDDADDADEDGINNADDNCMNIPNAGQGDSYGSAAGDACEDSDNNGTIDTDEPDICISVNGTEILRNGNVSCFTTATTGTQPNTAIATGAFAIARATNGDGNTATATAVGSDNPGNSATAIAINGNNNTATATGNSARAEAFGGDNNTAEATTARAFACAGDGDSNELAIDINLCFVAP